METNTPLMSRERIDLISERFSLGTIGEFAPVTSGMINPVFNLENGYIVKINTVHQESPKFEREKAASEMIKQHTDVRVPLVVGINTSREIIPYEYEVLEYCGENLYEAWPAIEESRRMAYIEEMARDLAKIHRIPLDSFGDIIFPKNSSANYGEYFLQKLRDSTALNENVGKLSPDMIRGIQTMLAESEIPDLDITPRLVHGDYTPKNLLIKDDRLTVIDFEWSGGDNTEEEIAKLVYRDKYFTEPRYQDALLSHYQEITPLDPGFSRRALLYLLSYFFEAYPELCQAVPDNTEAPSEYRRNIEFWFEFVKDKKVL